jgi:capsid assembly protease
MRDYPQIVNKMTSTPWFITEAGMSAILEIVNRRLSGEVLTKDEIRVRLGENAGRERSRYSSSHRNIGVLSMEGPMFPKANLFTELSGATSIEQATSEFRTMLADDSIDSILLNFDSPGGSAEGIQEFAKVIFDARESGKRIVSMANFAANSAAYYLASQAQEMYATPSGQVGSVGVVLVVKDDTRAKEDAGIDQHVFTAGRLKAVGYTKMTSDGAAYLQDIVDTHYEAFVGDVARGRNTSVEEVVKNFGEGGIVLPQDALDSGMIDGVATFDEVVSHMSSSQNGGNLAVAAKTRLAGRVTPDMSYDADKEHSEPGTGVGGEPTPREPPEKDDPAIKGGWRRDPPPIAYEPEERSEMNRDWLIGMLNTLGVSFSEDSSDDELAALVQTETEAFVAPIAQAAQSAESEKSFARDFPEQAAQLESLRVADKDNKAKAFASSYARFDGSNKGFSVLVREGLEEAHVKVSDRNFNHDDLAKLVDSMAGDVAVVNYGEQGSAVEGDSPVLRAGAGRQEIRQQYADEVKSIMTNDGMTRNDAIAHLRETNPELTAAYINSSQA